ncbi:hypothetical protein ACJJH9_04355 [Microbulbifer sp. DLAB2-AF]|uniref:hypothetical protein n=1 Tax=Microbulbifer sp. DLAB2-AF TaxID=3243395 RepID=UPI00403A0CE6
MNLKFVSPSMRRLFFTLSVIFISGCVSTANIYERNAKANELEAQAEDARVNNNYSMAKQLDRKAEKLREKDSINKEDIVAGIFSELFKRLFGGSSKNDQHGWQ